MQNKQDIKGSIVALVTPMDERGAIDWDALDRLLEWHVSEKTDAILAVGTTGESSTLSPDEHKQVIAYVVQKMDQRAPVIAGTGSNSTEESIDMTAAAAKAGADAALLVVPYYNKPTQHGLVKHFATIAEAVDIPQILYNVPSRTITDLLPETLGDIAPHKNIIGIKEASGDIDRVAKIQTICGNDFRILSGDDTTCCELMLAGGHGCISVTANVAPRLMQELCSLATHNEQQKARALQERLTRLHSSMFLESNPIPAKYALSLKGMIQNHLRLPLTPLSSAHEPQIKAALQDLNLMR